LRFAWVIPHHTATAPKKLLVWLIMNPYNILPERRITFPFTK
jgi:hypothetical protein